MSPAAVSRRAALGALTAALAGLLLAIATTGLLRWLGTAAVLTTAPVLWRLASERPWWQQRKDRLPAVLLLALAVLLLGPLLRGDPPASRDHGIHYYQVHLLVTELLPSGRLWGWSPSLNNGYPFGESYPVLGYLWMAAAHLLSFGAVSLRTSYAWGLASLWMVSAAVAWWLAAMVTRELGTRATNEASRDVVASDDHDDERQSNERPAIGGPARSLRTPADVAGWAGLAAAAMWLLDPGASRQGGWNYLVYHGVWPQLLAATLWALSIGLTFRALQDPRPRRLALAVLALGGSLWSHPFALLTATASTVAWLVLILVARQRWPGPWRTWAVVHVGGVVLGAGWVATFFGSAEAMARAPVPWEPLAELGTALLHGRLFEGQWAVVGPLALLGVVVALRRGGALAWAVVGLLLGQLVLASDDAIATLRLDLVLSGFKNLQFPRYAIPLKPLWFALAGVGVGRVITWAHAHRGTPRPLELGVSAWIRRGAAGLLLAPLVATLVPDAGRLLARPVAALDTLAADGLDDDEAELLAALKAEAAALPPERPLVVAVMRADMGGGTYPVFTITDAGGRLVLDSHIPTVNFKYRLRRRPAAYASLGVTHVIHDRPVPDEERELAATLEPVGEYGPFTLERFTPPRAQPPRIAELEGFGTVEVLANETERLELQVSNVQPGTTLALGRAPHHRWEITLDGEPLEPLELRLDGGLHGLGAELPGPGRVVVQYVVTPRERRALWISIAAFVLCLVGVAWSGPPLATHEPSPRARTIAWVVVVVGTMLAVFVLTRRQQTKLDETWAERAREQFRVEAEAERQPTLVRDLVVDDAIEVQLDPTRVCSGLLGKNVLEGCSEAEHAPATSFLYHEPYLFRCLRVSIPAHGTATLQFPELPDDDTVVLGMLVRHDRRGSGKKLLFGSRWINQPVLNLEREFLLDMEAHGPAPTLGVRNEGRGIEQICVAAAFVRRP